MSIRGIRGATTVTADEPDLILQATRELLEEIRHVGLKSALGSASKNARDVIRRLGIADLLDAISDGSSVERQKPAPDLFLHAARLLNLKPEDCVVVEDAAAGIEAARAGGFRTLGLGPRDRVGDADIVFDALKGVLLAVVLNLLGS